MEARLAELERASRRDQDRWLNIEQFAPIDWTSRVSEEWLREIDQSAPIDVYLRFFAVIARTEIAAVLESLRLRLPGDERLVRTGRDVSGRHWCVAHIRRATIVELAKSFPSIQSIHQPLSTPLAAGPARHLRLPLPRRVPPDLDTLPTISTDYACAEIAVAPGAAAKRNGEA